MNTIFTAIPGVQDVMGIRERHLFSNSLSVVAVSALAVIDAASTRDLDNTEDAMLLRSGLLMGEEGATNQYRNSIIGVLGTAISSGTATSVTVPAAIASEVSRLIAVASGNVALKLIGPPTAGGTVAITSITATAASGTTITISSGSLPALVVGSIIAPGDGSQIPVTFVPPGYGIPIGNTSGGNQNQVLSHFYAAGDVDVSQIVNYANLDVAVQAWVKSTLRTKTNFTFTDDR